MHISSFLQDDLDNGCEPGGRIDPHAVGIFSERVIVILIAVVIDQSILDAIFVILFFIWFYSADLIGQIHIVRFFPFIFVIFSQHIHLIVPV